jgi:2-iminobutanoate/2-iminopropanoate deaminase
MKIQTIRTETVGEPRPGTWSNAKICGNHFFIAGMTAHDMNGNIEGDDCVYSQAKVTFRKIKHLVEAAGGKMDDIIDLTIFVTDIRQREEVWRARAEFFSGDFPCCALVEVSALGLPALKVEVKAQGFIGGGT